MYQGIRFESQVRKNQTTAYVASTLPIAFLDECVEPLSINTFVLDRRTLLDSYNYLQQRHPSVYMKVLPDLLIFKAMSLLILLLRIRFSSEKIIFFHECCCPVFDLLVKLIRPHGDFYPQVTLQSFLPIPESSVPKTEMTLMYKALRILRLQDYFNYYQGDADNSAGYFIVMSIKHYPSTIQEHEIGEVQTWLKRESSITKIPNMENRVLLLCGRDVHSDQAVDSIYRSVVDLATKYGYACDVKDHPSERGRLNFKDSRTAIIDPSMPVELVPDQYTLVIGMGSTGLLHFSGKAVSLLCLRSEVNSEVNNGAIDRRVIHLTSLSGENSIEFPKSVNELEGIFIKHKNISESNK